MSGGIRNRGRAAVLFEHGGPPRGDIPEFFTAIQEQLGLKVQPETMQMPVFIVDSIERPSET